MPNSSWLEVKNETGRVTGMRAPQNVGAQWERVTWNFPVN